MPALPRPSKSGGQRPVWLGSTLVDGNILYRLANDGRGIGQLGDVHPFHVAAFVKHLQGEFSPPTVKQHLAALRMLFDWLVTGHVLDVNPAHAVRGPKYVIKQGKTPMLTADEA
jgi:site-specific recombinase XerC